MKEKVWNILNTFRMKHWLSESKAEIDISEYDKMMDEIEVELNG